MRWRHAAIAPDPRINDWLERADRLLSEPDPGPTPFLVDQLIVEKAITAIQGRAKVGKTWLVLELAISIVTGRGALGRFEIPTAGPVIIVLEESGRDALHRRLDALRRGYGLEVPQLADLHFAANRRVRLNDEDWRTRLLVAAERIEPRAVFFDPLARLKGATVEENSQKEMAPALDFMRDLRDATKAAVAFVQHVGHEGGRMRGTSDLEAYWESKIVVTRDERGLELSSEHREAEAGPAVRYVHDWQEESRSLRLSASHSGRESERNEVYEYVREHPGETTQDVAKGVGRKKQRVQSHLESLETTGTVERRESRRPDRNGRPRPYHGWYPVSGAASLAVPITGTATDHEPSGPSNGPTVPAFIRPDRDRRSREAEGHEADESPTVSLSEPDAFETASQDEEAEAKRVREKFSGSAKPNDATLSDRLHAAGITETLDDVLGYHYEPPKSTLRRESL